MVSERSTGCRHRNRAPARNSVWPGPGPPGAPRDRVCAGPRSLISHAPAADTPKLAASMPIAAVGPSVPEIRPASSGPATLTAEADANRRPLASVMRSPSTRLRTAVTYVTWNTIPMAAPAGSTAYSSQTSGRSAQATGTSPYSTIRARSHPISRARRSRRSATTPAARPAATAATPAAPVSRPICATDPVARSTSSGTAMSANESPATDSVWAAQKIVKLRSRHSGRARLPAR